MDIESGLRDYIRENFLLGGELSVDSSQSLLAAGVLDSTGVLELITFMQERFGIRIADEEVVPENLDSIDNLVRFVERKQAAAGSLLPQIQG